MLPKGGSRAVKGHLGWAFLHGILREGGAESGWSAGCLGSLEVGGVDRRSKLGFLSPAGMGAGK